MTQPGSGVSIGVSLQYPIFLGLIGRKSTAITYILVEIAKLNVVDLQAWLTDVLVHIAARKINCIDELPPWRDTD